MPALQYKISSTLGQVSFQSCKTLAVDIYFVTTVVVIGKTSFNDSYIQFFYAKECIHLQNIFKLSNDVLPKRSFAPPVLLI